MPILAGVASTVGLIIALTGLADPTRHRDASRVPLLAGWILAGLSMLLALTAVLPSGLTGGSSAYTQPSGWVCTDDCDVPASLPTVGQADPMSAVSYPGAAVLPASTGPTGSGQ